MMDEIDQEEHLKDVGTECVNLVLSFLKKNKSTDSSDDFLIAINTSLNLLKHVINNADVSIEALREFKDKTEKIVSSFFDEAEENLKKRMN